MVVRLLALILIAITAGPTWACGILDHAEPKVGAVVSGSPSNIRLAFSEAIVPAESKIELTDATGKTLETKPFSTSKSDSVMLLPLGKSLPPGDYKVHWQVLWKDCGSTTEGHYGFTVAP